MEFLAGNIYDLDFEDETFDVVHAHQVLQHLTDPVEALREMRRVAKPGGIVAVRDADFRGMSWYPTIPELDEWMDLYQRIARRNGAEPDAGRRLVSLGPVCGLRQRGAHQQQLAVCHGQQRRWQARVWGNACCIQPSRIRPLNTASQIQRTWPGFRLAGTAGGPPTTAGS